MGSDVRRLPPPPSLRRAIPAGGALVLLALLPVAALAGPFVPGPASDQSVGTGPRAIATGDLNGDGRPDMIVGLEGSSGVSVLLGQAGGGFAPAVTYDTGAVPGEVVIADFDGDGHLDFAVGHYNTNTVVIMRGIGDGTFTAGLTLAGPPHPEGLAAADLDGDGQIDLAACGYNTIYDGMASVWLNTGTPGGALAFGARTDYAVGAWPNSIHTGTFANLRTGLVTANYNGASVSILENDGTGHFGNRTDLPVPPHVYMAAVGDLFPGLSRSQIVSANADSNSVTLYAWNDGTSSWVRRDYATPSRPTYVAIADADGDGTLDVVTSNYVAGELSVFPGAPWTVDLHARVDVPTVTNPYAVAVADFDLDGKPDLVASDRTGTTVRITRGLPKRGWALDDTIPTFTAPDQNGNVMTVGAGSGTWRLIDICSRWCVPCNEMAAHTEPVYAAWLGNPSIRFEYVTMLVDGRTAGVPSTLNDALAWGTRYTINRPILHSGGLADSGASAVARMSDLVATPTLRLVDPNGVIRWLHLGAVLDESTLVRVIANCAGVPAPSPWLAAGRLLGGIETVTSGAQVASGVTDTLTSYGAFLFNQPPGTFGADFYSALTMSRDLLSGREFWSLALVRWDGTQNIPMSIDQPWQITLSNLVLDPATRTLPPGTTASFNVVRSDFTNSDSPTPVPVTWDGSTLAFGTITPDMLAPFGSMLQLTLNVTMQYEQPIANVTRGAARTLALAPPSPNPAARLSRLAWAQPRSGAARLDVFDLGGRLVRTLASGEQAAGEHVVSWDLVDAAGTRVRPGLYFAHLSVAGEGARTVRVSVVR